MAGKCNAKMLLQSRLNKSFKKGYCAFLYFSHLQYIYTMVDFHNKMDFHITRSAYYVKVITDPQAQGQMLSSHFSSVLGSVQPAIEV